MSKTESSLEKHKASEIATKEHYRGRTTYSPSVDIVESKEELVLVADMPGVSSDSIDVHFEKGELFIHGRVEDRQKEGHKSLLREYGVGDFYRVFTISEEIDAERISAEYKDGVLTLHLPKVDAVKPRKIEVKGR